MKNAWHIIDETKSQYFLVNVLPHQPNATKIPIQYQKEKYHVHRNELLPYASPKHKNIYDLEECNEAVIIDWIRNTIEESGFWVKINSKLTIDFNQNADKQRQEFIRFIFGRFMISQKRKQYLCIANDESMCNKNGQITRTIFNVMSKITNLWNYKISLQDLSKIYGIFFRDVPMKLKICVQKDEIIKLTIVPYNLFSKELLGGDGITNVITLTGRIFNVMAGSKRQLKNYYKVPIKSTPTKQESQNLEGLTNFLLHIGFTVSSVKEILSIFALIMNLNELQLVNGRKNEEIKFKIKEGSIIKDNIQNLMGADLTKLLLKQLNAFPNGQELSIRSVQIKQQLLIRIIYEQIILKVADLLNERMCNISKKFQDFKEFIVIQFPPIEKYSQDSIENYYINLFNEKVEAQGLNIPFPKDTHQFQQKDIYQKIKDQYLCDINKDILQNIQSSVSRYEQIRRGQFIQKLKETKIDCIASSESKPKVGKIKDLFEELENIEKNRNYFKDYIIQTTVNEKSIPYRKHLLTSINKSLLSDRERYRSLLAQSEKISNEEEAVQSIRSCEEQIIQDQDKMIEIGIEKFQKRYTYCEILKKGYRSKSNIPIAQHIRAYFESNPSKGKLSRDGKQILINLAFYQQLQKERLSHDIIIDKIKRQFKAAKFRHSMFKNLKKLYGKTKLSKFVLKKIQPKVKQAFQVLKKRLAAQKISRKISSGVLRIQKRAFKKIKIRSGISIMVTVLKHKQSLNDSGRHFIKKLKQMRRKYVYNQFSSRMMKLIDKMILRRKRQCFNKFNRQYQIFVNPPQELSNTKVTSNIPQNHKPQETKRPDPVTKHAVQVFTPHPQQKSDLKQSPIKTQKSSSIPVQTTQTSKSNVIKQQTPPPAISLFNEKPQQNHHSTPIQQASYQRYNSFSNEYSSFGNSTNRGIEKSETSRKITEQEFFSIKDCPKFSFQIWIKEAVGFKKRKPVQIQNVETAKELFVKSTQQREPHKQTAEELNVDILIKEKVVVNPFFPYLMDHIAAESQQKLQKIMSHQDGALKAPLLSDYPQEKYSRIPPETFNNILKIGLDKNTTKSKAELINMIVRPIRETYYNERVNVSTVFQGEPTIITDYSWDHNIVKDEIFMQFIKQIMMNQRQQSLNALATSLEVITRYYYPSPKFLYPFLHFLKSLQSKNIEKLNQSFINTLLFAQIYERYKGSNVTILKEQVFPKQKESHVSLEPRTSQITQKEIQECLKISVRFLNNQAYEYSVRNQTLSHFKRKALKQINLLHYEEYFGIYYSFNGKTTFYMVNESKKAVDHLNEYPQTKTEHFLYIKLKFYFPFNIKQINKTRIMYLNSVFEEKNLPFRPKDYESIVVLSMIFDQFQEERISNYLMMTNQFEGNVNLTPIQTKYTEVASARSRKIGELQYFRQIKEFGFLGAKGYRIKDESEQTFFHKITKIVTKPLQLSFYRGDELVCSIDLHRIKGYGLDKGEIHIEIDFVDKEGHQAMRNMTLRHVERIHQLYADLTSYVGYLSPH